MIGPRAKGNRGHSAARRRSISRAQALIRGISDAALFDHSLGWSASARRAGAVILTHAISTVCLATITRRVYAVARPARTSSTICGTVKPCAIMMASVHPSREAASSSSARRRSGWGLPERRGAVFGRFPRSEEHTSELQSHLNLVCRLLLEKKKTTRPHMAQLLVMLVNLTSATHRPNEEI